MKNSLFSLFCFLCLNTAFSQNVNIPDANFKAALVNNSAINTNGDGEIQVAEAAVYKGLINVTGKVIFNLTGIEAFTELTNLDCSFNALSSLNISINTNLVELNCSNNFLKSLDIAKNKALVTLNCSYNSLTNLDVSVNTALVTLSCSYNSLPSLDVSSNTALLNLGCANNSISSLDISANTSLVTLICNNNKLNSLDVSANTALVTLSCSINSITSLDISENKMLKELSCGANLLTSLDVSKNNALVSLYCSGTSLASLDVSKNSSLNFLQCINNKLTSLNIQNGNNTSLSFYATGNPSLSCIQVDNVAKANSYNGIFFYKDASASYSTDCGFVSVLDIDPSATVQIMPNPANDLVTINSLANIQSVELINMQGQIMNTIMVNGNSSLIDVSNIANGIYLLKINGRDQFQIERLLVQH